MHYSDSGQVLQQSHCWSNEIHWHWFSNKMWPECVLPFVKHAVFFFWNFRMCSKRYLSNGFLKTNHGMALNKNRLRLKQKREFFNCVKLLLKPPNSLIMLAFPKSTLLSHRILKYFFFFLLHWDVLRCGMKQIKSQLWPYLV